MAFVVVTTKQKLFFSFKRDHIEKSVLKDFKSLGP